MTVPLPDPGAVQLPLAVQLRDDATLENFLPAPSQQALLAALQQQRQPDGEAVIYLYGPAASGRTHLLQAGCHLVQGGALYLPLGELAGYAPEEVLAGIETLELVCLDDIHRVLGNEAWELALFNLYNAARASGCRLLVSGDAAPRALQVHLPDLRSRLGWGIVYQLTEPNDDAKGAILQFRAERRGLVLTQEVTAYIVSRAPRSLDRLLALLEDLDRASLAQQRALSVPFVKQVLGW